MDTIIQYLPSNLGENLWYSKQNKKDRIILIHLSLLRTAKPQCYSFLEIKVSVPQSQKS